MALFIVSKNIYDRIIWYQTHPIDSWITFFIARPTATPSTLSINYVVILLAIALAAWPLLLGWAIYTLKLVRDHNPTFSDIFSGYSYFLEYIGLVLLRGFLIFVWSFGFLLGGLFLGLLLRSFLLQIIGGVGTLVISSYKAFSYSMASYIMADTKCSGREAIKQSKELMKGKIWKLFVFELSFLGWFFLSFLTLGLGSIFLFPYISTALTAFYIDAGGSRAPDTPPEKPRSDEFTEFRL